jgi:hypothetical protein
VALAAESKMGKKVLFLMFSAAKVAITLFMIQPQAVRTA